MIVKACPFDLEHTACCDGVPRSWSHLNKDDIVCRAWVEPVISCHIANQCEDVDQGPCGDNCPRRVPRCVHEGYCKLINRE
jgi:hypothetical protein